MFHNNNYSISGLAGCGGVPYFANVASDIFGCHVERCVSYLITDWHFRVQPIIAQLNYLACLLLHGQWSSSAEFGLFIVRDRWPRRSFQPKQLDTTMKNDDVLQFK